MNIALIVIGLVLGGVFVWFFQNYRFAAKTVSRGKADELESKIKILELEDAKKSEKISSFEVVLAETTKALSDKQEIEIELKEKLAREETERSSAEKRIKEQREEFDRVKEQLKADFQNLANSILEEKTTKFTQQNKENLDNLLKPLGEKIKEFKEKVESTHEVQTKDGATLREQIKQLTELNVKMSREANNLTNALKGESKTMGNWGELVLETILESSGLKKNEEYIVRGSFAKEDGGRSQPDVVVNLPDEKHLVIDSKVSLVAYERYCSEPEEGANREGHLKHHIASIRNHIGALAQKSYQDLYQIRAPDFVMMFIPLDPALIIALENDSKLYLEAYDRGIFLVCPATLLFALRTVAVLWRREKQNANALEIAKRGGALYDKFVSFYDQLVDLGTCIKKTQECYDDSLRKLKTGKGSLVRQAEMVRQLGAKATRALPQEVLDDSDIVVIESDAALEAGADSDGDTGHPATQDDIAF